MSVKHQSQVESRVVLQLIAETDKAVDALEAVTKLAKALTKLDPSESKYSDALANAKAAIAALAGFHNG